MADDGLYAALMRRGMTRRSFLQLTTAMTAVLALPATFAPRIAAAVEQAPRLPVIWLRGQDCGGETEAFLRAPDPSAASLLLDMLSVEYHESLMAAPGAAAELARTTAMERYPDGYVLVVEGSIPTGAGGAYCIVGGRPFADIVREVSDSALATLAVGACAFDGGVPGAGGGVTGARSAHDAITGGPLITLPGCPVNVDNLVATIVHYLTLKEWPATDGRGRPLFAYGPLIHNECERRPHFEFGEFVQSWGDEGAQKGWCLYKMGCKGPESFANCASQRFAQGTSWPIHAGHGCIGCTMPAFWDAMSPFYRRLPSPVPFFPSMTADGVGTALVGGIGAVAVAHGVGMYVRTRRSRAAERRAAAVATQGAAVGGVVVNDVRPLIPAVPAGPAATTAPDGEPPAGLPGSGAPRPEPEPDGRVPDAPDPDRPEAR
jgi:hydrogenase small subunit